MWPLLRNLLRAPEHKALRAARLIALDSGGRGGGAKGEGVVGPLTFPQGEGKRASRELRTFFRVI